MASRAAIEEQIRLLNEQLVASTAYDPEFTPKELVRWNPDLIGTVLHCEDTEKMKIRDPNAAAWSKKNMPHAVEEGKLEAFGILTIDGMQVLGEYTHDLRKLDVISNDFISITKVIHYVQWKSPDLEMNSKGWIHMYEKQLDIKLNKVLYDLFNEYICTIPLLKKYDNILDAIYISNVVKFPYGNEELILHKYPLSRIYKQWKQEKDALAAIPKQLPTASAEPEDPRTKP